MKPEIEYLDSCGSTNTELARKPEAPHGYVVCARSQSAGRGQRGNSWESEPGKNLTFSLLLRPGEAIPPGRQFELSMIVSLGIVEALAETGVETKIKWPNDIYTADDRKICGILIENSISGISIERSIVGVGINVNQEHFVSDAPNPVSVKMMTGHTVGLEPLLENVCSKIMASLADYMLRPDPAELSTRYHSCLWRADGALHPFRDAASGIRFDASIAAVASDGTLTLDIPGSPSRNYIFKEVEFLLK